MLAALKHIAFYPPSNEQTPHMGLVLPANMRVVDSDDDSYLQSLHQQYERQTPQPLVLLRDSAPVLLTQAFARRYFESDPNNQKLDFILLQRLCEHDRITYEHDKLRALANNPDRLAPYDHNKFSELFSRQPSKALAAYHLSLVELLVLQLQHTLTTTPELFTHLMPCYRLNLSTDNQLLLLRCVPAAQFWQLFTYLTEISYTPAAEETSFASLHTRLYATVPPVERTNKRYWCCLFFLLAIQQQHQLMPTATLSTPEKQACARLLTYWLQVLECFLNRLPHDSKRHPMLLQHTKSLVTTLSPALTRQTQMELGDSLKRIETNREAKQEAEQRRLEEIRQQQEMERALANAAMAHYGQYF